MLKIFCLPQILLVFLCSVSIAQNEVKGRILDAKTGEEISYATVYIDGTSIGTISDSTGEFSLIVRSFPSQIVVRHLSYERYVYLLKEWGEFKNIYLIPRFQHVSEVQIQGADHRAQNLEIFREEILGTDKWGRNAKILNENKISFFREELKTDTEATNNFRLIATSKEPLKIYIPLLGYLLHFDLVRFESTPKSNSRLGFYYYEPIKDLISRKKRSIEKTERRFTKIPLFIL